VKSLRAVMLREDQIGGVVIGADQNFEMPEDTIPILTDCVLKILPKGTLTAQWSQWSASTVPLSYKSQDSPMEEQSHVGTRFLQHYLDSLGGINTFG